MLCSYCLTIPRPLSGPQVMESVNQDLAAIDSWCLKWYTTLNPKKTKSMVLSRSLTNASCYGDLALSGAVFKKVKSLIIIGVILDSKLTFETHLREILPKAATNLGVEKENNLMIHVCSKVVSMRMPCPVYSICTSVWISSAESHLGLPDSVVRIEEKLCEGELCCLKHKRKSCVCSTESPRSDFA